MTVQQTGANGDSAGQQTATDKQPPSNRAHVIVIGNEKGGSGKSTTAMHLIVSLMKMGFKVGSLDIDARQGTLTRYVENRTAFNEKRVFHFRSQNTARSIAVNCLMATKPSWTSANALRLLLVKWWLVAISS